MNATVQADAFAGTVHQRPRPTQYDRSLCRAAAEEIMPEVEQWIGEKIDDADRERIVKILTSHIGNDGYETAREFEREGYFPDADLVEILDNLDTSSAHSAAVRAWLVETGATPQLSIGTVVPIPSRIKEHQGVVGEIVRIDEHRGEYTVCCESLGHVREGLGTHGLIFAWEEVEAAQQALALATPR